MYKLLRIVSGISDSISELSVIIAFTPKKNSSHFIAFAPTSPLAINCSMIWNELHSQRRYSEWWEAVYVEEVRAVIRGTFCWRW